MKEIWKDIKDYEGIYQASNLGRIRTVEGKTTYSERHGIRRWKSKILKYKGYTPKTGYRVSLWKDKKNKDFLVARLVAFTFLNGDINDRWQTVNHKNGDRMDNRLENLEIISLKENIRHGFKTGLYSNVKPIILIDKKTKEEKYFYSSSEASRFLNMNHSYIHNKIKKGIYELDDYFIKEVEKGD